MNVRKALRRELPGAVIGLAAASLLVCVGSRGALAPLPASAYPHVQVDFYTHPWGG